MRCDAIQYNKYKAIQYDTIRCDAMYCDTIQIKNSLHLARKYARIFVRGHYLFREAKSFRERSSRKTVSFEEQIMCKDKYPSIFSPQMEAIAFILLQIFFATDAVLKIGEYLTIIHRSGGKYPSLSPTLR